MPDIKNLIFGCCVNDVKVSTVPSSRTVDFVIKVSFKDTDIKICEFIAVDNIEALKLMCIKVNDVLNIEFSGIEDKQFSVEGAAGIDSKNYRMLVNPRVVLINGKEVSISSEALEIVKTLVTMCTADKNSRPTALPERYVDRANDNALKRKDVHEIVNAKIRMLEESIVKTNKALSNDVNGRIDTITKFASRRITERTEPVINTIANLKESVYALQREVANITEDISRLETPDMPYDGKQNPISSFKKLGFTPGAKIYKWAKKNKIETVVDIVKMVNSNKEYTSIWKELGPLSYRHLRNRMILHGVAHEHMPKEFYMVCSIKDEIDSKK